MLICLIFFSPLFLWYVPLFSFTSSTLLIYALFHLCCSIIERVPLNSSKREERAGRVLGIVIVTIKTTITIMDCCYVVIVVTNCCHSYHDGSPGSCKPHFVSWSIVMIIIKTTTIITLVDIKTSTTIITWVSQAPLCLLSRSMLGREAIVSSNHSRLQNRVKWNILNFKIGWNQTFNLD